MFCSAADKLYRVVSALYPRPFRSAFEQEMQEVFSQSLMEACHTGWFALWSVLIRELFDFPGCLLDAHFAASQTGEDAMVQIKEVFSHDTVARPDDDDDPGSWVQAILAAWPLVLIAILSGGIEMIQLLLSGHVGGWVKIVQLLGIGLIVLLLVSVLLGMVLAWRRRFPRWFGSWTPFLLLVLVMLLNWPLQEQNNQTSQLAAQSLIYLVLPIALVVLIFASSLRDRLRGLLVTIPILLILWTVSLEFTAQPYRNLVSFAAWMLAGLAAALIVRLGKVPIGMWLGVGVSLVVGLLFCWARTYHHNIPPQIVLEVGSISALLSRLFSGFISITTLVVAPLLVWSIRQVSRRSGTQGIFAYRLAIAGLLIELIGYLAAFWWHSSFNRFWYYSTGEFLPSGLVYLGMSLYLIGMVWLFLAAWRWRALPGVVNYVVLSLIPFALPLMAAAPMLLNFSVNPPGMPFEIYGLRNLPMALLYVVGLVWLMAGCWLAARFGRTNQLER